MSAPVAKIITVTSNSAIDYVLEVNDLLLGETVMAQSALKFAAGKGINVAKAVAALEVSVWMLGFVGIQTKTLFQALNSSLVTADFCFVEGETRTHITLSDFSQRQETHIRTAGFSTTPADCQRLFDKLNACIQQNDIVVFSGSLPNHAPVDFYAKLIALCHQKGAVSFLDSSGDSLRAGLKAKPYLIKPNLAEFESLVGRTLPDEYAVVKAAREIIATGVKYVLVSRAEQGALLICVESAFAAFVCEKVEERGSHVGCGDALVAGFAVATFNNHPTAESLKLAVACGTANLFSQEPGMIKVEKVAQLIEKVQVRVL